MGRPVRDRATSASGAAVIFTELPLAGAFQIDLDPQHDERGYFARSWCEGEAAEHGIDVHFVQSSVSFNKARGTLRGLHYQRQPHGEFKLVRCLSGKIFDVIVDLRPNSKTFSQWAAVELDAKTMRAVFVPQEFAHGFMTMSDDALVAYDISTPYVAEASTGIRWDDPKIGICWPEVPVVISERDRNSPLLA